VERKRRRGGEAGWHGMAAIRQAPCRSGLVETCGMFPGQSRRLLACLLAAEWELDWPISSQVKMQVAPLSSMRTWSPQPLICAPIRAYCALRPPSGTETTTSTPHFCHLQPLLQPPTLFYDQTCCRHSVGMFVPFVYCTSS
jgi:hypothetical protein